MLDLRPSLLARYFLDEGFCVLQLLFGKVAIVVRASGEFWQHSDISQLQKSKDICNRLIVLVGVVFIVDREDRDFVKRLHLFQTFMNQIMPLRPLVKFAMTDRLWYLAFPKELFIFLFVVVVKVFAILLEAFLVILMLFQPIRLILV